ncbi:hypothetical protein S40285_08142 [Stachybotrys chlorohalonatus IBT 40285]|uniref:Uncharacterized protein n=1 Tax=Stachybotrys chlorohalonatus (strain IBT 40285) TaxID=1283841 RepID=A0A084QQ41_STAC4|nr:hypothetical protein S40285_08142 [Stachybotrys chlorohalonata IBT 40285]
MDRSQPASSNLMDLHNRLVADVLTRYRTLMMLATVQAEGGRNNASPEAISVAGISMKMEFDGLYSSVKELLTLSRRIKELWVYGPLARDDPTRQAKDLHIDEHVGHVAGLLSAMDTAAMARLAAEVGAEWQPLVREDASQVNTQVTTQARTEAAASQTVSQSAPLPPSIR